MSKHTPGPWESGGQLIVTAERHPHPNPKAQHRPKVVGEVHWDWGGDRGGLEPRIEWPEAEANQRLMIAAPELLEACKKVLASIEHNIADDALPETRECLREAITKATGDTV